MNEMNEMNADGKRKSDVEEKRGRMNKMQTVLKGFLIF